MPSREHVQSFIALVVQGKYVEAIQEFYAEDASMQENQEPPRKGIQLLVAGEEKALAAVKEIRTLAAKSFLIDGDRVAINWLFEIVTHDGRSFRQDEIAWQLWRGDKIVEEQFYYDPGQRKPA
ncbi:Ketosteroid isomerase-related protein [Collimonas sp. OK307]|uniref:nuclear transport factor 2 family protein n=1 Tax=Collimonas sp. OK307 TaxID=1801620 RepID=UPI0008F20177|nr:nuclear transport factor 2 family protein [Collimonas sp. OK307]SFI39268.1 Ketosteroid isomerase-related protein [Collimonas sp. OK307]